MLHPLDSPDETIQLIANVTGFAKADVRQRLRDEVREIGTNVHRSLTEQGIPMYVASEALDQFYRENDSFLFETTVWNTCAAKQRMRDFIQTRLEQFLPRKAEAFCFGDGLGFDSTWLAMNGHTARYFEPSIRCQQFATEVFQRNQVQVSMLNQLDDIEDGSLDVVVCLDVLEHVPKPQGLVQLFHRWLKPDGLLFVHAPFWCLHWTRATHLQENRYLSGNLRDIYEVNGFSAVDASLFWDPILLQKTDSPTQHAQSVAAKVRIKTGKTLLGLGRRNSAVHTSIARMIARAPKSWRSALR